MAANISSQWSMRPERTDDDMEKHAAFVEFARATANRVAPWLFPLLDATNANVCATLGQFGFWIDYPPYDFYEIPELAKLLTMEPWRAEDDIVQ